MSKKQSTCIPPPTDYSQRAQTKPSPRLHSLDRRNRYNDRQGYTRHGPQSSTVENQNPSNLEVNRVPQPKDRFYRDETDDYFARVQDDDADEDSTLGPEPEQKVSQRDEDLQQEAGKGDGSDDEDDDPLDAYMKSLEQENASKQSHKSRLQDDDQSQSTNKTTDPQPADAQISRPMATSSLDGPERKGIRLDIEGTDDVEEVYFKYVEQKIKAQQRQEMSEAEEMLDSVEYDKDGNVISVRKIKREVEPLPAIDHSTIHYEDFERDFYTEHADIERLTPQQAEELRSKLEIKVSGNFPPKPVCSFAHFKFDERLMRVIRRSEYTNPTPIQAQAIPAALLGRNIIGIAVTGSGKTAAYLWPMIVHIMGQPNLKKGDGPIGLVLVPTRELALQVYGEARKFSHSYNIATVCAYGGGSKYEQSQDLESGAEIVIATPGRLIDLIKGGATNLRRVTYLVLDEADRFFDMGFEAQVRSICDQVRPDRQTLLFSATFKHKIEKLARTVAENPVRIVQKTIGEANEDVKQHVVVLKEVSHKWNWLLEKLVEFTSTGSVLIFVTRILNCEELHKNLAASGRSALLLHGDMEQSERNRVISSFKRKESAVMIATDVAARGLDISHIRTVINYDVARDIDTHIHRVGRTGRAGLEGDAYTLLTAHDKEFAGHLAKSFQSAGQNTTNDLMRLAAQSNSYRKSRGQKHTDKQHRGAKRSWRERD